MTGLVSAMVVLILGCSGAAAAQPDDSLEFSSYAEMRKRIGDLHTQKQYEAAADILERHIGRFPAKLQSNAYNLAFFRVLLGRYSECLDIMEYALDRGVWFNPVDLDIEDWAPIKGMERFTTVRVRNDSLLSAAQAAARPDLLVVTPPGYTAESKYPLFIALHGGNGNMNEFKEVWKSDLLMSQFIVAYVQSSQVTSMTGFWWEDYIIARKDVRGAFEKVVDSYSVDTGQVITGGFSSGGMAALDVALWNSFPVAGFVVLCPGRPTDGFTTENLRGAGTRGMRGTIITTSMDPRVDIHRDMAKLCGDGGIECRLQITPDVGHWIPDDIDDRIDDAIGHIREGLGRD